LTNLRLCGESGILYYLGIMLEYPPLLVMITSDFLIWCKVSSALIRSLAALVWTIVGQRPSSTTTPMSLTLWYAVQRPLRFTRAFHVTALRRDLIGPSDPVSNLRLVIYDDAPPPLHSEVRHPYSLREFRGDTREYQWKIQRQELDAYNHAFWTEVRVFRPLSE
jgi:hypothetical protein